MKIVVMGTGGLGGYFGGRLAQAGLDVTFIARGEHLAAIQERGLRVKSTHGGFVVKPTNATDDPAAAGLAELILFCVKAYDAPDAAEQIKPLVSRGTAIIPVLNGIDHIALLGATVGAEHVLGGLAAITAHRLAPGVIEQVGALDRLEFGEMDGRSSERCEKLWHVLSQGGFTVAVMTNVRERMWWKLVTLAGVGLCSVVRTDVGVIFNTPKTAALAYAAMSEAVRVAQAQGVMLPDTLPDELVATLRLAGADKPSMLIDLEHGRRLEVEWLNGAVSRYGKATGVPTPVNDFIYACLQPWVHGRAA
jgi:2-dehydropantoate 2-reductase